MELSDYEKRRQENLKRNREILASLNIPIAVTAEKKPQVTPVRKKRVIETDEEEKTTPSRISLRLRNIQPEIKVEGIESAGPSLRGMESSELEIMRGDIETKTVGSKEDLEGLGRLKEYHDIPRTEEFSTIGKWITSFDIQEQHIAKVVPSRIYSLAFHNRCDSPVIFAGDKAGNIGIWDVKAYVAFQEQESEPIFDGISVFKPHKDSISCLRFAPDDPMKLYSCSYDGSVRCLDINKDVFEEKCFIKNSLITWFEFDPTNPQLLYFSTTSGTVGLYDTRGQKPILYNCHSRKVGCLSINPTNPDLFITSSLDTTAAVWDARMLNQHKEINEPLVRIEHKRALTSAFFCPNDGSKLLTTCYDDHIRLYDDVLIDGIVSTDLSTPKVIINHNNQTGRWITPFKSIWAPSLYEKEPWFICGNMKRYLDVYSGKDGSSIAHLQNADRLTAQPAVNSFHQSCPWIASGTGSGRIGLWTFNKDF